MLVKALERVDPRKTGEGENNDFTISCMMAVARAMIQRINLIISHMGNLISNYFKNNSYLTNYVQKKAHN
jgi:hypothetical protein